MKALILVDIQNDFVSGGALAVPEGETIVPIVNELQKKFDFIIATQDFHPANHGSFAANHEGKNIGEVIELNGLSQILWPVHCVQNTEGTEFVKELDMAKVKKVFVKGTDTEIDSYSGFFDNGHRKSTGLSDYLKEQGVTEVYVTGLAADYCVKFTALDAVGEGFKTYLISDATKGVNMQAGDVEKAIAEMKEKGIKVITSEEL
ncbi:bifunctional nicotinamidase/pyrazinamidase [Chondrinema litorale]|uniref:bifunctional nicotinamidase/pyrazinamidase n=1 Tax=Chondrinema litorale TaxID=2994555 RepID=UPI0025429B5E|nr:bifunctional nicotinamidase/pyrazinamidase [Chondrinema litorale]UZR95380.1 bifunctional nicotinamidase/pyrazinamidase [Chondrinema litorale]